MISYLMTTSVTVLFLFPLSMAWAQTANLDSCKEKTTQHLLRSVRHELRSIDRKTDINAVGTKANRLARQTAMHFSKTLAKASDCRNVIQLYKSYLKRTHRILDDYKFELKSLAWRKDIANNDLERALKAL